MKILWDTTYFLPLIKISIEGIPDNLLLKLLIESKNEFFYSDLSIFEIIAKGLKIITRKTEVTLQDIMNGIDAIQNDSRLQTLTWSDNPLIIELVYNLKAIHNDTIDCIIYATAICKCDCIITMDHNFYNKIRGDDSIIKEIKSLNKNFQFWFGDLSEDPIPLKK